MMAFFKRYLACLLLWLPLGLTILYFGANLRISGQWFPAPPQEIERIQKTDFAQASQWLRLPRMIRKARLNGWDAFANSFSLFAAVIFFVPLSVFVSLALLFSLGLPLALFLKKRSSLFLFCLCALTIPIAVVLFIIGFWLALFFQPCTFAYPFIWLLTGICAIFGGLKANWYILESVDMGCKKRFLVRTQNG